VTRITDTEMTSDQTRHTAVVVPGATVEGGPTAWSVSWLPGRLLRRNQAITAMTIAETVATADLDTEFGRSRQGSRWWGHLENWASELGISGPYAVAEASLSPEDHEVPRAEWPAAGRPWQAMTPADFDTNQPPAVQLALFAEPDTCGTPDLFDAETAPTAAKKLADTFDADAAELADAIAHGCGEE
jgi:hypothetical protein